MSVSERTAASELTFPLRKSLPVILFAVLTISFVLAAGWSIWSLLRSRAPVALNYQRYMPSGADTSGYQTVSAQVMAWPANASLEEVASTWNGTAARYLEEIESNLATPGQPAEARVIHLLYRASVLNFLNKSNDSYETLAEARSLTEANPAVAEKWLYSIIYFQGVTALRRGENENCIMCRGESSCILPISPAAIHTRPEGSRLAIRHFTEYLEQFPDQLEVRWLLNIAHMTLGEHPHSVKPEFLISLDRYTNSEFDIGKFRDVGHLVGVNRFNYQGGGAMEDFDDDGLLDIITTANNPTQSMSFNRNKGDGKFEDFTKEAGLSGQLGGLYCVQVDFDNDGFKDVFIPRGAWLPDPVRPSLLRNDGNGTFSDVTKEVGLATATNSLTASWADYDNDGFLDLFLPDRSRPNRLYRNLGGEAFEEVAESARVAGVGGYTAIWNSGNWFDFDNDGFQDLFVNSLGGRTTLYHNNRNGTFSDVTVAMKIDGPKAGFACWAWDYDNDGWQDIFATCYEYPLQGIVHGLLGKPHGCSSNKLYRNLGGMGFQDVTKEVGLDLVFATMGCNFGDFDNDGFLDMYLGTGGPDLAMLVPNRMFKNVAGQRFAEITGTSGTGNLQKGHSVACGDWDRNGTLDIFIEMGGVTLGDMYHNILFQNPGQGNHWLNVRLVGTKTNHSAIGARIKVVTTGENPLTIYRHVTVGSTFGANPLEQLIGLGKANQIAVLEIYWPTSDTTQVFRNLAANQAIEIIEFATDYSKRDYEPILLPAQ